jgi:hypothetical protein
MLLPKNNLLLISFLKLRGGRELRAYRLANRADSYRNKDTYPHAVGIAAG